MHGCFVPPTTVLDANALLRTWSDTSLSAGELYMFQYPVGLDNLFGGFIVAATSSPGRSVWMDGWAIHKGVCHTCILPIESHP